MKRIPPPEPQRPGPEPNDYSFLKDGDWWELERGEDFSETLTDLRSVARTVRSWATRNGYTLEAGWIIETSTRPVEGREPNVAVRLRRSRAEAQRRQKRRQKRAKQPASS